MAPCWVVLTCRATLTAFIVMHTCLSVCWVDGLLATNCPVKARLEHRWIGWSPASTQEWLTLGLELTAALRPTILIEERVRWEAQEADVNAGADPRGGSWHRWSEEHELLGNP